MQKIYINGKFLCQRITGVQRYAREMLYALDQLMEQTTYASKVQLHLVVPNEVIVPPLNNIQVIRVGSSKGHLWEQLVLPRVCGNGPLLSLSGSAPFFKFNQYFTIHDAVLFEFPSAYSLGFRLWYRVLFAHLAKRARRVYTVSEFSYGRLAKFLPALKNKTVVVSNGHEHFYNIVMDASIIDQLDLRGRPYTLLVGSRNQNKNFARLARVISENFSDSEFLFVLAGDSNLSIFNTDTLSLPANVIAAGYVSDGALKALYAHASGFIFPSIYEGFGLPLLEAMSVGCPVLTSNTASMPEVCGGAAMYFDPVDEVDIARSLRIFLADEKLRADLSKKGFERAKLFSWANSAKKLLDDVLEQELATQ